MYDNGSSSPLLRLMSQIRRARDFRLYTGDGRRILDLWQYGGKAVLGHTVPHQLRELKNNASRGLFAPFPNHFEGKLEKVLHGLFPERVVRIYKDKESMQEAFDKADFEFSVDRFLPDPAAGQTTSHHTISLWRPFLDDAEKLCTQSDILLLVLPFPYMNGPRVLMLDRAISHQFPPSDLLSSVVASCLLSSVQAFLKQMSSGRADYSQLFQNLSETSWQHRGIYLFYPYFKSDYEYEEIFNRFLHDGFLIPPKKTLPWILPVKQDSLSQGEAAKLSALLTLEKPPPPMLHDEVID